MTYEYKVLIKITKDAVQVGSDVEIASYTANDECDDLFTRMASIVGNEFVKSQTLKIYEDLLAVLGHLG